MGKIQLLEGPVCRGKVLGVSPSPVLAGWERMKDLCLRCHPPKRWLRWQSRGERALFPVPPTKPTGVYYCVISGTPCHLKSWMPLKGFWTDCWRKSHRSQYNLWWAGHRLCIDAQCAAPTDFKVVVLKVGVQTPLGVSKKKRWVLLSWNLALDFTILEWDFNPFEEVPGWNTWEPLLLKAPFKVLALLALDRIANCLTCPFLLHCFFK